MFLRLFFSIGFVGCLLLNVTLESAAATVPNAYDLFENIKKSVQAIHSGQVKIENSVIEGDWAPIKTQWTISFDKDKNRADVVRNGYKDYLCYNCYGEVTRLSYSTIPLPVPDGRMALVFTDGHDPEMGRYADYIPEPRWFGFIPMDILASQYYSPTEMYDTSAKRQQSEALSVKTETVSGIDCWRVDYAIGIVNHSIWLNKLNHYHVVCVENQYVSDDVRFVDRVLTEGTLYDGNIWFPKKLNYIRTENGTKTRSAETTIEVISLNKPLPPDTFSPKTIVKPNTPVAWHLDRDRPSPEDQLVWDGEKVVPVDKLSQMMNNAPEFGALRIALILVGIALILLGIGLKLRKRYL